MKYALDLWNDRPVSNPFEESILGELFKGTRGFVPAVDVVETPESYRINIDLPGLKREDINVELKDRRLTISGERNFESERKDSGVHVTERRFGAFQRSFYLPDGVETDKIKAKQVDGVLQVEVAKAKEAKPKKIDIS